MEVFTDLCKAFGTFDHNILLKKIEIYGISGTHLQWFQNYLSNRKQYIQFGGWHKTNYKTVKCSDDTNLFNSNKNINTAFLKVNDELQKINKWFISNELFT